MKLIQLIVLAAIISVIVLSSCSPVIPPTETTTLTPSSTYSPVLAPTSTPPSPTALPTQPESTYTVITPEPAELERWQEYEEALGNAIYERVLRVDILCEWLIVGRDYRKVYVWVACSGIRPYDSKLTTFIPGAVVYLGADGEVQSVGTIENTPGSSYGVIRRKLFPPDILEIFEHMPYVDDRMLEHLESRRENPEPPLIVLSAMSAPNPVLGTLLPTQLTIVPTLNPTQVIQQEEIKSVIQEYFEIHYQALSISPPEDFQETGFGDLVSDGPEAKDFLVTEMAKLAVERKHLELKKYRYTEYEYSLDYLGIVVEEDGQIANVHLVEKFVIFCELSLVDDPEDPKICVEGDLSHVIVLRNEQRGWKIISDAYWDSWWMQFRKPGATIEEILNAIHLVMQRLETMPSPTP